MYNGVEDSVWSLGLGGWARHGKVSNKIRGARVKIFTDVFRDNKFLAVAHDMFGVLASLLIPKPKKPGHMPIRIWFSKGKLGNSTSPPFSSQAALEVRPNINSPRLKLFLCLLGLP